MTGGIAWEAVLRLAAPGAGGERVMVWVAAAGIAVNGATALLFASGRARDLNIKSAFLHMAADTLVTAGVVVAGIAIGLTGWLWLDPAVSLVVSAVIVSGTWGVLKRRSASPSTRCRKGSTPPRCARISRRCPGSTALHDLHIWGMSTTETALTCHLVMPGGHPGDATLSAIAHELHARFGIVHATIQIELGDSEPSLRADPGACRLRGSPGERCPGGVPRASVLVRRSPAELFLQSLPCPYWRRPVPTAEMGPDLRRDGERSDTGNLGSGY